MRNEPTISTGLVALDRALGGGLARGEVGVLLTSSEEISRSLSVALGFARALGDEKSRTIILSRMSREVSATLVNLKEAQMKANSITKFLISIAYDHLDGDWESPQAEWRSRVSPGRTIIVLDSPADTCEQLLDFLTKLRRIAREIGAVGLLTHGLRLTTDLVPDSKVGPELARECHTLEHHLDFTLGVSAIEQVSETAELQTLTAWRKSGDRRSLVIGFDQETEIPWFSPPACTSLLSFLQEPDNG